MEKFVVTITREFGSLGRPIAKRLSEILDIEYYDRDIVEKSAQKLNLSVSVVSDEEEKGSSFFKMLFPLGTELVEREIKIFEAQSSIIRALAAKESCIIVGRCANAVLADEPNAIHVAICAPYEARLQNCIGPLEMKPEEAKRMIVDVDKARKAYHRRFAKFAMADIEHKHLIVNSELLGVEGTAQLLADAVRRKFGE